MPEMLTVNAVADELKISGGHVTKLIDAGLLSAANLASPGCKHRTLRVSRESLDALIARRAHNAIAVAAQKKRRQSDEGRRPESAINRLGF